MTAPGAELGQSADPRALVPGEPEALRGAAQELARRAGEVGAVGDGLARIDTGAWTGQAAAAFRSRHDTEVPRWHVAGDALSAGAQALGDQAEVVAWAQSRAADAIGLWEAGQAASAAHQQAVAAQSQAATGPPPPTVPPPAADPGAAQRAEAVAVLADARARVAEAATAGASILGGQTDLAPRSAGDHVSAFAGGVWQSVRETGEGLATAATDPMAAVGNIGAAIADPVGTIKDTVAYDDFARGDHARGVGRLVGEVGLGVLTGGVGKAAKLAKTRGAASDQAPSDPRAPGAAASTHRSGEPVDLGSGLLFQPDVDVALPGRLPLLLGRTHVSHYRAGRFFGPSWASTLDQHLEVGTSTVFFARADGLVLAFPRAGPWPVRSTHSRRWTLDEVAGGLVVRDRDAHRTLRFDGTEPIRWLGGIDDDVGGSRVTVHRSSDGTPREVEHDGGYRVAVRVEDDRVTGYDLRGAGPDGTDVALVRLAYTDGHLTAITNSSGSAHRYDYDDRGRITGWVDRFGTAYRHTYDDADRVVAQTGSDGVLSSSYTYRGDEVVMTDPRGHVWRYVHDAAHRVVLAVDPHGATTRQRWGPDSRVVARTDGLGRTAREQYDGDGALIAVVDADGARTSIERDARGRVVRIVGPDGAVEHHEHDDAGRRVAWTDAVGARTTYRHDRHGYVVVDALGGETRVDTDPAGLPVAVTDPLGATTRWERDAFGRVTAEVDPLGDRTAYGWTVEGLPSSTTTPDGRTSRAEYDGEGNLVTVVDPAGHVTRVASTHFDVPAARVDPDGARHEYRWDAARNLVEVRNPQGLRWRYEYDACSRLVAETDFDGRRSGYERDAAGDVVARRDASGRAVTFRRDAAGRVVERTADGVSTTFVHDPCGRLVAAAGEVDLRLERDAVGRVVAEHVGDRVLRSTYDPLGRRVGRVTPGGVESRWSYDAASRPAVLHAGTDMVFAHDAVGRETSRRAGAAQLAQAWGAHGLRHQDLAGSRRSFGYRADGHLSAIGPQRFVLDACGRVTAAEGPEGVERYAYDLAGNVVDATWSGADPAVVGERVVAGTSVRRAGAVTYSHDADGRVVRRTRRRPSRRPESWHFSWDGLDRLIGATTPDGTRWRYRYDPLGRRMSKIRLDVDGAPVEQVDFTWDGGTLAEQTTYRAGATAAITWDHDATGLRPVAQRERVRAAGQTEIDERFYTIVTDLVGTPTELVDESGTVAGRARRSLWGHTVWHGPASTPLRFPGQYHDPETGLAYNLHRHYDPDTARYTSPDPLGLAPAPHPVAYVHNPHIWADPYGLAPDGCGEPQNLDPFTIRHSQSSVNGARDIVESMQQRGWRGDPIDVVRMRDGELTTADNTRVVAGRHAGIDVVGNVHEFGDPIGPPHAQRMQGAKGDVPGTWGEAVENRISNQSGAFRRAHPQGSRWTGWSGN